MKSNYEERKAAKLNAYENLAVKNEQAAGNLFEQSSKLADQIPFGQPILVGHHSEKRHRAHIGRIHSAMNKGCEASNKAKYYADKVESLLNNDSISSDDPNAIDRLTEKLERLEGLQELMKDANKIIVSKKYSQVEKVDLLVKIGFTENRAISLFSPDFAGRCGFPYYKITNNGATIRATKQRIEHLGKIAAMKSSYEVINDVALEVSVEDNRVKLIFPSIPAEDVRKELKQNGFHWSPYEKAWMRKISSWAIHMAKEIISK